jgi:GNAT superfamily N-acetyltransferase
MAADDAGRWWPADIDTEPVGSDVTHVAPCFGSEARTRAGLADPSVKSDDDGMEFTSRVATTADADRLQRVMNASISELQQGFLTEEQIESSRAIMGIDNQLIADGTYYVVELAGALAGCGGWSRRATLYGSDATPGRDPHLLDPTVDAARVRAMYTAPAFARQGVGWLILTLCERAAATEGFRRLELMGTMSGQPLYAKYGFVPVAYVEDDRGGAAVPLVKMEKSIDPTLLVG